MHVSISYHDERALLENENGEGKSRRPLSTTSNFSATRTTLLFPLPFPCCFSKINALHSRMQKQFNPVVKLKLMTVRLWWRWGIRTTVSTTNRIILTILQVICPYFNSRFHSKFCNFSTTAKPKYKQASKARSSLFPFPSSFQFAGICRVLWKF